MTSLFINLARKRKSPGKINVHIIVYTLLLLQYLHGWKQAPNIQGERITQGCEHQILGTTLRVLHSNLILLEKYLIVLEISLVPFIVTHPPFYLILPQIIQ